MFNLNNANMENLITQINKERLVNSDTALMMKELYYYVPCEYWYDIPRCICASARHWQHVSNG
jgi:hypothetical protein